MSSAAGVSRRFRSYSILPSSEIDQVGTLLISGSAGVAQPNCVNASCQKLLPRRASCPSGTMVAIPFGRAHVLWAGRQQAGRSISASGGRLAHDLLHRVGIDAEMLAEEPVRDHVEIFRITRRSAPCPSRIATWRGSAAGRAAPSRRAADSGDADRSALPRWSRESVGRHGADSGSATERGSTRIARAGLALVAARHGSCGLRTSGQPYKKSKPRVFGIQNPTCTKSAAVTASRRLRRRRMGSPGRGADQTPSGAQVRAMLLVHSSSDMRP